METPAVQIQGIPLSDKELPGKIPVYGIEQGALGYFTLFFLKAGKGERRSPATFFTARLAKEWGGSSLSRIR
ncbi:MAG: hypothetical protein IT388_07930 [Nitrospirales bacterium]|nr:hypothetical protein [Nitrospirales bacterium]